MLQSMGGFKESDTTERLNNNKGKPQGYSEVSGFLSRPALEGREWVQIPALESVLWAT